MRKKSTTNRLVRQLHDEISKLAYRVSEPLPDDEMDELCDALFMASVHLTNAPTRSIEEIDLKLTVLCRRLRDQLTPEDRGSVLTALLAESIRDDLSMVCSSGIRS